MAKNFVRRKISKVNFVDFEINHDLKRVKMLWSKRVQGFTKLLVKATKLSFSQNREV